MRDYIPVFLLVSASCVAGPTDPLVADAEAAATSTGAATDAAEVSAWFATGAERDQGRPGLVDPETAAAMIAAAEEAIAGAMAPEGCVVFETDEQTYLEATMTGCTGPGGRVGVSGSVRGELGFETQPCGPAECPSALLWQITAAIRGDDGGELEGAWQVTAPFDPAETRTFEGAITAIGPWGREITSGATASWTSDDAGCVAIDASVTVDTAGLTIDGVARCPGECPSAGTVAFSAPRGGLAWSYDGSAQVTVTDDEGGSVALPLHCTPAP